MSLKSILDSLSRVVRIHNHLLNPETPPGPPVRREDHFAGLLFSRGSRQLDRFSARTLF